MDTRERRPSSTITSRQIKRILLMLGIGGLVIAGALSLVAMTYYRAYRHQADFLESIEEVESEKAERERFKEEVGQRLFRGDFDGLDAMARELRESRVSFPNGNWKLAVFHQGLSGPTEGWTEAQWMQALEQARRWILARPTSISARLTAADLSIGFAWMARGSGWAEEVAPEQWNVFRERMAEATQVMREAEAVEEKCPTRVSTALRLALANGASKEEEAGIFERAIAEYPDFQPPYSAHLRFLQPRWHGEPGDWERAAMAISKMPGGKEKYARAVWFLEDTNAWDRELVSWPLLKQGLAEMRARHPDSFEITSVSCKFASYFADRGETQARLKDVGHRMDTGVWSSRDHFARVYHWATFEQGEVAGGDPLARVFSWLMGS